MGDLPKGLEVDDPGIGGGTGQNHLGLVLLGQVAYLVVVNVTLVVDTISHDVIILAGEVDRRAVGQVAAVGQVHAEHGVTHITQSLIHRVVGVGAAVGLYVGVVGAKELTGTLTGDVLHHVHALAAAVIPLAGIAFGIFIGEHRGSRRQYRLTDKVLRGDKFNVPALPVVLRLNRSPYLRVLLRQKCHNILDQILSPPFPILRVRPIY